MFAQVQRIHCEHEQYPICANINTNAQFQEILQKKQLAAAMFAWFQKIYREHEHCSVHC